MQPTPLGLSRIESSKQADSGSESWLQGYLHDEVSEGIPYFICPKCKNVWDGAAPYKCWSCGTALVSKTKEIEETVSIVDKVQPVDKHKSFTDHPPGYRKFKNLK
jgi:hypothetical protein